MLRREHLREFYALLDALEERLSGTRCLSACTGGMWWPGRGVYFFRESGEVRTDSGTGARVVRVGTHALKAGSRTTLWNRLSQHRGTARSGGGNHRGSIFRLIVGTALIGRDGMCCPTWDNGRSSATREVREGEQSIEQAVSKVIGEMPILWLAIEDEPGPDSLRGYVEKNAIALLSNYGKQAVDPPSRTWLGHYCNREKVRTAGLWNSNHVEEAYDPAFLDTFSHLIRQKESET